MEISQPLLRQDEAAVDGESEQIPEWKKQITIRGLVVSTILGTLFCIIDYTQAQSDGWDHPIAQCRRRSAWLSKLGFPVQSSTRQENTVIQTCVVACYGLAFSGGAGWSYLLAMDEKTYQLIGEDYRGNRAEDVKNPGLLWMMGFIFVVSCLGLSSLVPFS